MFWDTPCRPMVTHTRDSHQIPSQNKTKSKLQILKNCRKFKFCNKLYTRHTFWSCLTRCINMKWTPPELQALQSGHGMRDGWTDRRTDGRTDGVKPIYPPPPTIWLFSGGGGVYKYLPCSSMYVAPNCSTTGFHRLGVKPARLQYNRVPSPRC